MGLATRISVILLALAAPAATGEQPQRAATTAPATRDSAGAAVPAEVVGAWYSGAGSPAVYSDANPDDELGRSGYAGTTFVIRADGTYELYVYVDMRSSGFVTQVRTTSSGRITFAGDSYTVKPTKGHRKSKISGKLTDRPLTDAELAEMTKTFRWRIDRDTTKEAHRYFVVPMPDGSEQRFRAVRPAEK